MKFLGKGSFIMVAALLIAGCRDVICLVPSDLCPTHYSTVFDVCGRVTCDRTIPFDEEDAIMAARYKAYERAREKKVMSGLGGSLHKKDAY